MASHPSPQPILMRRIARAISIVGHPLLTLPAAVCFGAAPPGLLHYAAASLLLMVLLTVLFIAWHVRRGDWDNVDASRPHERARWNAFLAILLLGASAGFAVDPATRGLALGFSCALLPVLLGMLLSDRLKLSQHVAYATFTALLLAGSGLVFTLAALLAVGPLAWSRVVLEKHTPLETAAGMASGMLAGGVFWLGINGLR
ncbi:hypothetical protein [Chitinolyticbacter albus]|uniref:hypothetical protein n=1 Tax=Chitinolyticbacter albus TaxID=2961951 RepID=UPI00210C9FE6|nr:hypothetical protein [Chitinolyticbacter albus]